MEINWKEVGEFSAKKGAKPSTKALLVVTKHRITLSSKTVELMGLKPDDCLLFGEFEDKWFIKRNSKGFKLRSDGKTKNLIFSCKLLKEQLLALYNAKKKEMLGDGCAPSEACSFLVVEVEEITDSRVFQLFPMM